MNRLSHGQKFGRLTFIELLPPRGANQPRLGKWSCECGVVKTIPLTRVKNGYTRSCGCLVRESKPALKHGMKGSPEYSSWTAMNSRCRNRNSKDFSRYGAKGVTVCQEWKNSFESFFSDVGPRPQGTTLDRIKPELGYRPGNVRWATPLQQARNRTDLTILNTPAGIMPLVDYAAQIGISRGAAHLRMKRGKLDGCTYVSSSII